MIKQYTTIAVIVWTLFLSIAPANASVTLFNNLGPGSSYDLTAGTTISHQLDWLGTGSEMHILVAMSFVPASGPHPLETIAVAINHVDGDNILVVQLNEDNGGLPGALIESWGVTNVAAPYPTQSAPVLFTSTLNPVLQSGTQYWVVASSPAPGESRLNWLNNSIGTGGPAAILQTVDGIGSWSPIYGQYAMRVVGGTDPVTGVAGGATVTTNWSEIKKLYR